MGGLKIFWPCLCRAARSSFYSNRLPTSPSLAFRNYSLYSSSSLPWSTSPSRHQWIGSDWRQFASAASNEKGAPEPPPATEEAPELKELETLKSELTECQKKADEFQDKYKRALAEAENVRNRMQRQVEDAKLFGIQGFCKDLLEVADILGKATESIPVEALSEANAHLKNLHEGLVMTEAQLQKVFTRHGLVKINPLGEKFNPNEHEALFEQVVEGKAAGTVAVVTKIGYKLHHRTLRPALVGVAKAS